MNDYMHLWMATAIIAMIVGVTFVLIGKDTGGIVLVIIAAMAWNEVHYLQLKEQLLVGVA